MALSYTARRRWALVILLLGLPIYIIAAIVLLSLFERQDVWIELGIYVGLGVIWAIPFRMIFRGIGQADPTVQDDDA